MNHEGQRGKLELRQPALGLPLSGHQKTVLGRIWLVTEGCSRAEEVSKPGSKPSSSAGPKHLTPPGPPTRFSQSLLGRGVKDPPGQALQHSALQAPRLGSLAFARPSGNNALNTDHEISLTFNLNSRNWALCEPLNQAPSLNQRV